MPPSPLPWAKVTGESSLTGSPVASSRVAVIVQLEPEVRVAPQVVSLSTSWAAAAALATPTSMNGAASIPSIRAGKRIRRQRFIVIHLPLGGT